MRRALVRWLCLIALAGDALAQAPDTPAPALPAPGATPPPPGRPEASRSDANSPAPVDAAACARLDLTPGALLATATDEFALATPIPWSEFVLAGRLLDDPRVVHALLEPTLEQYRTSLSLATMPELALVVARFGYQLVGHHLTDNDAAPRLVLDLAPLPLVRRVNVDMDQGPFDKLLEDEVLRRMTLRVGSYLPWDPVRRGCALLDERRQIEEFLFDEGYYEAKATMAASVDVAEASLRVEVDLGDKYTLGTLTIGCPSGTERRKGRCIDTTTGAPYVLALTDAEIRKVFEPDPLCLIGPVCYGKAPFTRARFQEDVQQLKRLFQQRGYPSVRVVTSDPRLSFDRARNAVDVVITIDERRQIDVQFEGHDRAQIGDDQLRAQLTFDEAGSADDVEIAASARAITTYLQTRGLFDAHVTWSRERIDSEPRPQARGRGVHLDRIVFRIAAGARRRVVRVEFMGNRAISTERLEQLVATKEENLSGTLFGTTLAATSSELLADRDRIVEAYRRIGHTEARVAPSASPRAAGVGDAALTAALLGVDDGEDLYVRFAIDEGPPTLLARVVLTGPDQRPLDDSLCAQLLGELATRLGNRELAARSERDTCAATVRALPFHADDVSSTRDQLRDYLFRSGRGRATVGFEARTLAPRAVEARYTIARTERLKLGKVVIRGNFKTSKGTIYEVLDFDEGELLTTDRLADGARKLRATGLFDAVNIEMPELECDQLGRSCNSEVINAVIRVEERYDHRLALQFETGYSSLNGLFGTARATQRNLLGRGISLTLSGTYGTRLTEAESQLRFPSWLVRQLPLRPEVNVLLTGTYRDQDTDRFGRLLTQGVTAEVSRLWSRARSDDRPARNIKLGPFYQFRVRSRNVDSLRPIGSDMDESQVAVSTRTGAVGLTFDWEQRVDRNGQLQPLAPEAGFRFEASGAVYSPYLLGGDTFLKFTLGASRFIALGRNVVVRADVRYDHGVPLGGAVLLPEVERFSAGGDNTVRGYGDERLLTQVIQVGLPPFDNASQIRVIPAGGNIRALGSLDAQVRIWKILAGALFTDAGLITNQWSTVEVGRKWGVVPDIPELRPSVGMGLRALTPFGIGALEYAVPLRVRLGDDPRGRIHFYFAARAQF